MVALQIVQAPPFPIISTIITPHEVPTPPMKSQHSTYSTEAYLSCCPSLPSITLLTAAAVLCSLLFVQCSALIYPVHILFPFHAACLSAVRWALLAQSL
jgi:hypothetical protein